MTVFMFAPLAVPLLGAVAYAVLGWRPLTAWVGAVSAGLVLAAAVGASVEVAGSGEFAGEFTAAAGVLRADALTAFLLVVVGAVALLATVATPAHLAAEIEAGRATGRTARWHCVAVQLFLAATVLAVLAADLGLLWVGIEVAVLATGFLVGQGASRAGAEAAWKVVVVCSAGLALALLGVVFLETVGSNVDGVRIAVVLLVVGFGAMAGLAPLHAWLPDAHGQAPAPVAALLSGVLASVAVYAILRVRAVADVALGPTFGRVLLAALAVASLLVAASLLLAQRDYQRMLAYSSTGQLGLVALGAAIGGPLALAAALLHLLGHAIAKAVLLLGAGRIRQVTGTNRTEGVRGLAARHPMLAGAFGVGVLALLGLPPFSLFASGLGIARAGFAAGLGWLVAVALVLVLAMAVALVAHTSRMLLGEPPDSPGAATAPGALAVSTSAALVGGLVVCAALGVAAEPLATLLRQAAETVSTTPGAP
ncbi:MAG: proton-conducting transporter membrane subunit [Actinophytocola sp.]|uniref:proton-conducting transporter transmembrane domain-containing protein n=1 Tax=Actinophytocola sp. TaxID=1872138 RepID=UPI003D6A45B1